MIHIKDKTVPSNNAFEKKSDFLPSLEEEQFSSSENTMFDEENQDISAQQAMARLRQKTIEMTNLSGLITMALRFISKNFLLVSLSCGLLFLSDMVIGFVLNSNFLAQKTSLLIGSSLFGAILQGICGAFSGLLLTRSILLGKIEREETPLLQGYSVFLSFTLLLSLVSCILGTTLLTVTENISHVFIKNFLFYSMIAIMLCPISFIIAQYGLILSGACAKRKISVDIALEQAHPFLKLLFKIIIILKFIPMTIGLILNMIPLPKIISSGIMSASTVICMIGIYIILPISYRIAGYLDDKRYNLI